MGAKMVKKLLSVAGIAAIFAADATASIYEYEASWEYRFPPLFWPTHVVTVSGDAEGLVVPTYYEGGFYAELHCYKFDANGNKKKDWLVSELFWDAGVTVYGLITFQGDVIIAYQVRIPGAPQGEYSALQRCGVKKWSLFKDDPFSETRYFQRLARAAGGTYYYCYRYHDGRHRVCKSPGTKEVISYFNPVKEGVSDIVADGAGHVYVGRYPMIYKYHDSGSLLASWGIPSGFWDLTLDPDGRLLVLSSDKNTYVYDENGSILGSFTAPYTSLIRSADMGPDNKYFVLGVDYAFRTVSMYRFAPDPTNVLPTSFGKIKAMYK